METESREFKRGDIVKHFKRETVDHSTSNYLYKIIGVATHTETHETMMVYQALYGDFQLYVRPYYMFISKVDKEKYPNIKQEYRFEKAELNRID
jgi:hypothetical protein